ncbi:MAG: tRNA preQ1(34) S-adenosylmethionine ribosyltransferase-isomerase QueA [Oscillospiraceae bacterium]|nr:tRNA preQ1(34) S-adenosylmethionine ribosyltransferase-isomerase QueA [Oscillospiraceae bacterium]
MKTADFSYDLPSELIAQSPSERRDHSRMMVINRATGELLHRKFYDLPCFLRAGDCLVLNNSRVIPARLLGHRIHGGVAEILLLGDLGGDRWDCLVKPGKNLKVGARVFFGGGKLTGEIERVGENGERVVRFTYDGMWNELLNELGAMPLPHYIRAMPVDAERYQTVYADPPGSAAAPTAGLHFTPELLDGLRKQGIRTAEVTLHVGLGTFLPVKAEEITSHRMHTERYEIGGEAATLINRTRQEGGRVVAVGTTSCRTLESAAGKDGLVREGGGETDIFITPGYTFRAVDALITNYHLPRSTLLMLVSAFYSREGILAAYREAVRERYRFYSFGDAMLIL